MSRLPSEWMSPRTRSLGCAATNACCQSSNTIGRWCLRPRPCCGKRQGQCFSMWTPRRTQCAPRNQLRRSPGQGHGGCDLVHQPGYELVRTPPWIARHVLSVVERMFDDSQRGRYKRELITPVGATVATPVDDHALFGGEQALDSFVSGGKLIADRFLLARCRTPHRRRAGRRRGTALTSARSGGDRKPCRRGHLARRLRPDWPRCCGMRRRGA